MKKILYILSIFLLLSSYSYGYDYTYYVGLRSGLSHPFGATDDSLTMPFENSVGGIIGYHLHRNWVFEFGYTKHKNYNDSTKNSSFAFNGNQLDATQEWQASRYSVMLYKSLNNPDAKINLQLGIGSGLLNWEVRDPSVDTVLNVTGLHNEQVDYDASELIFSSALGLNYNMSSKWTLSTDITFDYLTGGGVEFDEAVKSARNNYQLSAFVSLKFLFGGLKKTEWSSDQSWRQPLKTVVTQKSNGIDSDGDGVSDAQDKCPETVSGALVDKKGCPIDSDGDSVPDGLDNCPGTSRNAYGSVDINGCPIDSDFDGFPDYLDNCPDNKKGAHVDANGCPLDSDGDSVPDGLDDCPNTLFGVDVDKNGCIDLTILSKPLVLNINYLPGSLEVDPNNRERLKQLSRILNFVKDIKLDINGYTDNIGTTVANKKLSEKRARRVLDYLVGLGIEAGRIKVFGLGESNFIASNQTSAGRAKNRRIEIVFYK